MVWGIVFSVVFLFMGGCTRPALGPAVEAASACPALSLSPAEVDARYEQGRATIAQGDRGEYYEMIPLNAGLRQLRDAALHGHRGAIREYSGHLSRVGIVQMRPVAGLSAADAAEEAMMWKILRVHRGEAVPAGEEATYRVLLDPAQAFPSGFFDASTPTGWMFQMLPPGGVERARTRAYELKDCWKNPQTTTR